MLPQDTAPARELRLILGDQLNPRHSWFQQPDPSVLYVVMEVASEASYVKHHVQKVAAFFLAMRAFATKRAREGHRIHYISLTDSANKQSIVANVRQLIAERGCTSWAYQLPDEWRLDVELKELATTLAQQGIGCTVADTEHFLTSRDAVNTFFGKKQYLMERFYRHMRTSLNILMLPDGTPLGERWNFDSDNRNKYDGKVPVPRWPQPKHDVTDVLQALESMQIQTIGRIGTSIDHAVTEEEAEEWLHFFIQHALPHFGTYEDAMDSKHPFLFHSRLSFLLNVKLLHPLQVVKAAEAAYHANPDQISLSQVEGFVRQIIGWREYMRGVYWAQMPGYQHKNFFDHKARLPKWYWDGKTKMRCLSHAVNASLDHAWAHHIQRLMITGSFALLLGTDPDEVDQWYLGIYLDAVEWVEITNTRGMSQYADGGLLATKPYVSAAAYVDKMSDYCKGCHYDKKKRHGEGACPFNSLYWDFYHRHRDKLARNPRIGMAYVSLNKMDPEELKKIVAQAAYYKANLDQL